MGEVIEEPEGEPVEEPEVKPDYVTRADMEEILKKYQPKTTKAGKKKKPTKEKKEEEEKEEEEEWLCHRCGGILWYDEKSDLWVCNTCQRGYKK